MTFRAREGGVALAMGKQKKKNKNKTKVGDILHLILKAIEVSIFTIAFWKLYFAVIAWLGN